MQNAFQSSGGDGVCLCCMCAGGRVRVSNLGFADWQDAGIRIQWGVFAICSSFPWEKESEDKSDGRYEPLSICSKPIWKLLYTSLLQRPSLDQSPSREERYRWQDGERKFEISCAVLFAELMEVLQTKDNERKSFPWKMLRKQDLSLNKALVCYTRL